MKRILKKIFYFLGGILLGVFLVVTLAFSSRETEGVKCEEIAVRYAGNQTIRLTPREIKRIVSLTNQKIIGKKLSEVNTETIEARVARHPAILKADAYKTVARDSSGYKGVVTIKVRHRIPVLRVISADGNFFLDKTGSRIPASVNFAANVPLVTGNVRRAEVFEELLSFVNYIQEDHFWRAQIKQIHVTSDGELVLSTLAGNQLIDFGSTENMEEKFDNLHAFYEQVMNPHNWNKYKRIIVKFRNQVIAKK